MTTPSASKVILVDSSGWLEYVTDDTKAEDFAPYIEAQNLVFVPTIVLYEVYKRLWLAQGKTVADRGGSASPAAGSKARMDTIQVTLPDGSSRQAARLRRLVDRSAPCKP